MSNEKSNKKKFSIINVIIGVVVVIVISYALFWAATGKVRHKIAVDTCTNNLKQIYSTCKVYVDDHNGKFPDSLEQLKNEDYIRNLVVCPSDKSKKGYEYVIEPGITMAQISSPSETPLVVCKYHKGIKLILYADGSILQEQP